MKATKEMSTEATFIAPAPEDKDFLTYYKMENPFEGEHTINEELKMVLDGREPIMMDDYSVQFAPLLEDQATCSAWICLPVSSLPDTAYFAEDGYIYDRETPGLWSFKWDENHEETWTLRAFYTKKPAD